MSRNIRIAFDFDVKPEEVAHMLRQHLNDTSIVILGYGEYQNGIPLNTIAVIARNETGNE